LQRKSFFEKKDCSGKREKAPENNKNCSLRDGLYLPGEDENFMFF